MAKAVKKTEEIVEPVSQSNIENLYPIKEAYFHQPVIIKAKGVQHRYANDLVMGRSDCTGLKLYTDDNGVHLHVASERYFIPFANVRYIKY